MEERVADKRETWMREVDSSCSVTLFSKARRARARARYGIWVSLTLRAPISWISTNEDKSGFPRAECLRRTDLQIEFYAFGMRAPATVGCSMKRDAFDRVQRLAGFRRLGWREGWRRWYGERGEGEKGKGDRRMCWTRAKELLLIRYPWLISRYPSRWSAVQQWSLFCRRERGYRCWTSIDWKRSMRLLA